VIDIANLNWTVAILAFVLQCLILFLAWVALRALLLHAYHQRQERERLERARRLREEWERRMGECG
jgi:hypothetical protein